MHKRFVYIIIGIHVYTKWTLSLKSNSYYQTKVYFIILTDSSSACMGSRENAFDQPNPITYHV